MTRSRPRAAGARAGAGPRADAAALPGRERRWDGAWIALALVAGVAAIYAQTAGHSFVALDDDVYVYANPVVARGLTWNGVVWAFTQTQAANWHPLTWISHMIDGGWFGVRDSAAGMHHLMSVALHALNAVLLYFALRSLSGQRGPSAFAAALFAVHPLRVESVAWASERKDVLSGACFMLALLAYARYAARPSLARMAPVFGAHVAGLLAKPMLVTLPLVLLVLDFWPLRRWPPGAERPRATLGALWLEKAPLFLASLASGVVTLAAQRSGSAVADLVAIPLAARLSNAVVAVGTYLWKSVWPSGLACFYPHPATLGASPPLAAVAGCAALALLLTGMGLREARRRPYLLAGWLWTLVMLLPVIGLLQVGNQAWADRYAYLPTIGVSVAVVWLARDLLSTRPGARPVAVALGGATLVALAVVAHAQAAVWRDTGTLYRHALAVTRDNWFAENGLGAWEMSQGHPEEARRHLERSLEILPPRFAAGFAEAHTNLGWLLLGAGRTEDARRHLEQALAARPDFPEAHNNLAVLLMREGRLDEARQHCERALAVRPESIETHFNLAQVFGAGGRLEEAAREYRRVLELAPDDVDAHYQLGVTLAALGRAAEARGELEAALARSPGHPGARQALEGLPR